MTDDHEAPRRSQQHVLVLIKAMDILELLSTGEVVQLQDIASSLDLSKATCHRILGTLAHGGYVEQASRGYYRSITSRQPSRNRLTTSYDQALRTVARQAMRRLRETTGENVFLFSHRDRRAHCLDVIDGRYSSDITIRPGGTLAMHLGAAPRAMLAGLTDQEIWDYLATREGNAPADRSVATVYADVVLTRESGIVVSRGEVDYKGMSIGAAITDRDGRTVGAISVGTLTAATSPERVEQLIPSVIGAARQASGELRPLSAA